MNCVWSITRAIKKLSFLPSENSRNALCEATVNGSLLDIDVASEKSWDKLRHAAFCLQRSPSLVLIWHWRAGEFYERAISFLFITPFSISQVLYQEAKMNISLMWNSTLTNKGCYQGVSLGDSDNFLLLNCTKFNPKRCEHFSSKEALPGREPSQFYG